MEPIIKTPIIKGAIPASKEFQLNNFLNKNITETTKEKRLAARPIKVTILKGILECFIIPTIPRSYSE